jgi:hypothetical protein
MIDFLIKSTVCMGVLLGVYYLFMQNEKMHTFKRFYLIFSLVFSLILPFIEYNRYYEVEQIQTEIIAAQIHVAQTPHEATAVTVIENIDYTPYFIFGYVLIALIMAIRFTLNISGLIRKAKRSIKLYQQNAVIILLLEKSQPYTFLNYIFINKEEHENKSLEEELYTHELAHVRQKHTLDILFIEVFKVLFWFNPLLYFYKKAMQLNHEFLADEKVITTITDIPYYQNLLLTRVSGSYVPLTSSITYSITKNRFLMMTKTSGKLKIALKQFTVIPVITLLFTALCINNIAKASTILQQPNSPKQETPTNEDKRRDAYYAGVRIKIEDGSGNTIIDKPYEELTPEQKREYLFIVPKAKTKKSPTTKEFEAYKDKSKYAIWIDGKNVDNSALDKYKNTDFAYVQGSSVYKNARTKQHPQPYQFTLYTNAYFDKNLKDSHLKYSEKVFTLKLTSKNTKKTATAESNRDSKTVSIIPDRIEVTTPTKNELDSLQKADPVKYSGKEIDFLKTKISYAEKSKKSDISFDRKHDYTVNLSGPIKRDPSKIRSIEILQLTDMEKRALQDHDPKKYNDVTLKDYMAIKTGYINDEGQLVSETTYEKKPTN